MKQATAPLESIRTFLRRHPVLGDALRWALPALLFGAVLRVLLTSYVPYAYWGADSRSFYIFAHKLFLNGSFSIGEKRKYLYPLLMAPVSLLPGGALRWLPVFQHAFGLSTLLPLAYAIRKTLVCWRLWIVPVTVLYAGLPIVLWCEHELLGDHLFFATLLWTFGGWVAWVSQANPERARRLFWVYFIAFTLFILTKPSGRFVWPGMAVGLVMVKAWRTLQWKHYAALLVLLAITPTVGSKKQGAWMFYDAVFPLTQLNTPKHSDYKAEIRDLVERYQRDIAVYHALQDREPFYFLRDPGEQDGRPLWKALGSNERLKSKIYLDLAIEGVKARPDQFLYLGLQRVVFDANLSAYPLRHFADGAFIEGTEQYYAEAEKDEASPLRLAFGLPRKGAVPEYGVFQRKLEPAPGSWPARFVQAWVGVYGTKLDFLRYPAVSKFESKISMVRPKFLGWWLLAAIVLSLLPTYRRTLGVWAIIAMGYIFGVYLISLVNVHYIAPAWPILFVLLAVPADFLGSLLCPRRKTRAEPAQPMTP